MGKAGFWLRGARGKLAGASLGRGANGQTIIREIVTPKNPRTESQLVQRIIMKTVMQAYSTMKAITDHSFEGVAPGAATMAEFMRRNLSNIRNRIASEISQGSGYNDIYAFTPLKSEQYAPNIYIISKGSLPTVDAAINSSDDFAYISGLTANTYQAVLDAYGLQRGDQLTFVSIQGTTPQSSTFFFHRVILDPRNADGTEAPMSSAFVGADNNVNLPNPRNEGAFTHLVYSDGQVQWYDNRQLYNAAGVIVSRRDGESWLRSNCALVINNAGISLWPTLGDCLSMIQEGDIETRSKLYLNNAGAGRTAQAQSTNTLAYQDAAGNNITLVGIDYVAVQVTRGDNTYNYPRTVVAVDSTGKKYYIKLTATDAKYNGDYLVDSSTFTEEGAWDGPIADATNNNTVNTGDLSDDVETSPFFPWLFAQGVPSNIMLQSA